MNDVLYEDRENYRVRTFTSPNGQFTLTLYYQIKDGRLVIDDEVWEEADTVPTLDDILGDN